MRTEKTKEGVTIYRMHDLKLERERSPALSRIVDGAAPASTRQPRCYGATPETLRARRGRAHPHAERHRRALGADALRAEALHWRSDIRWGARHADMLSERPDGRLRLDMDRFHDVVPTQATDEFPFGDEAS